MLFIRLGVSSAGETMNYLYRIGDKLDDFILFFPLDMQDSVESWLAYEKEEKKFSCLVVKNDKNYDIVYNISDIQYFMANQVQSALQGIRNHIDNFTFRHFEEIVKLYGGTAYNSYYSNSWIAHWEKQSDKMMICYGRLIERLKNNITIANKNSLLVRKTDFDKHLEKPRGQE